MVPVTNSRAQINGERPPRRRGRHRRPRPAQSGARALARRSARIGSQSMKSVPVETSADAQLVTSIPTLTSHRTGASHFIAFPPWLRNEFSVEGASAPVLVSRFAYLGQRTVTIYNRYSKWSRAG